MTYVKYTISIPEGMVPYLSSFDDPEEIFARDAMLIYPFIQNATVSHGKAAKILGVNKLKLIEFYSSIGIPYLDLNDDEFEMDLQTIRCIPENAR